MDESTKTFVIGCITTGVVVIALIAAFYFGMSASSERYHLAMQQCIEARGTWVPTQSSGACITNNR